MSKSKMVTSMGSEAARKSIAKSARGQIDRKTTATSHPAVKAASCTTKGK